jgi:hypothetical protein
MPNIDTQQVVTLRGIMPAYCPALSESLFGAVDSPSPLGGEFASG